MGYWIEITRTIAEIFTALAALVGGLWAAWTYHRSAKLERAKWMKELYEKFYEDIALKGIRDLLDGGDKTAISSEVQKETPQFTDYLNFFEFLAYLEESGQIKLREIRGLFDYYLQSMIGNTDVARYVEEPKNGFEKLSKLMREFV